MQLNASRIKVLQAQDDIVISMKEAGGRELVCVSKDKKVYKKLIKDLIIHVTTIITWYRKPCT
jgi:V-type H+-transporting ATPase subunit E